MKQRFSSLDVKVIAHELSSNLVSLRLANIYDLSSKIFLLKFAKPDSKKQLVVDSGFRCHLTSFTRTTAAAPSDFVARLRKYLKTRRCTAISQVGTDRIIELTFSDGQYRLFLEFYAGGNVILTDANLKIITLLRIVSEPSGEGQEELRVGLEYNLENRQNFGGVPELTTQRIKDGLQKAVDRGQGDAGGRKKKSEDALRRALAVSIAEFPPMLVDHAMAVTKFDSTLKPLQVLEDEGLLDQLRETLKVAQQVIHDITSSESTTGWIMAKAGKDTESDEGNGSRKNLLYEDFHPFKPQQFVNDPTLTFLHFDGFNVTVDEFFSSIEGQKLESRLQEREATAKRKLEAAKQDQAKRLGGLQEVQNLNIRKAAAIEASPERVQETMDAVNGLIAQGMDWVEIGKLIELEQKRNNPVASIIKLPLKLEENTITLLLDEETYEDEEDEAYETGSDVSDSEDETPKKEPAKPLKESRLSIDIDLGQSPFANAREYYDQRRVAVIKEQKTLESSTKALKSTQQKIQHDLKKGLKQEKAVLRTVRQPMWFEKFIWFISSDGYMILGGRDTQQNEILYKKYLRKGDVYVHADVAGAGIMIIRNTDQNAPIPPSTLQQAGTMAVSCSTAWDAKANMPAWWVDALQVSKSTANGDFLPPGSFAIQGTKNFLPPTPLLLGFAVLFQIDEKSTVNHGKHRVQDPTIKGEAKNSIAQDDTMSDANQDGSDIEDKTDDEHANEDDDDGNNTTADERQMNPLQSGATVVDSTDGSELGSPAVEVEQSPLGEEKSSEETEVHDLPIGDLQLKESEAQSSADDAQTDEDEETLEQAQARAIAASKPKTQASSTTKKASTALPRGKKSKAKKAAQKYRDQDEEDRLAAERLIGAAAGKAKADAEAEAKAKKDAEAASQKERRRAQHARTLEETKKMEEARKAMLENGDDLVAEDESQSSVPLDQLVGWPLSGDELLEAIPVCAPWTALTNYKYKVKIQAGTQKKGKAMKEIHDRWLKAEGIKGALDIDAKDKEKVWPREMELLKGWKIEELNNVMPVSRVRLMVTGGAASSSANKKKGGQRGKKK